MLLYLLYKLHKMSILKNHNSQTEVKNYNGMPTKFEGYIEFNEIYSSEHEKLGYTTQSIKRCIELIRHPKFMYSRQTRYGISIYAKDETSPTGVLMIGSIPAELDFLLYALGKTGQLSPTEDKRSAH